MKKLIVLLIAFSILFGLCACGDTTEEQENEIVVETVTDLPYSLQYGAEIIKGVYSGEVINGMPSGNGSFNSDSGSFSYMGSWQDGLMAGKGTLNAKSMDFEYGETVYPAEYKGETLDGVPNGEGVLSIENGKTRVIYRGNFSNGTLSGEGYLEDNNYLVSFEGGLQRYGEYSGQVIDGVANGEGSFSAATDENVKYEYTGEWIDGIWDGIGSQIYEDNKYWPRVGHFIRGVFSPTVLEYYTATSYSKDCEFSIEEYSKEFLESNESVFRTNDYGDLELNANFSYKEYSKDASSYEGGLIEVKNLRVAQILVNNDFDEKHTLCILVNNSYTNVYYVRFYGDCPGIYEDNRVTLIALPLDYFSYKNTDNQSILAIACAGVVMKK